MHGRTGWRDDETGVGETTRLVVRPCYVVGSIRNGVGRSGDLYLSRMERCVRAAGYKMQMYKSGFSLGCHDGIEKDNDMK
jgi:hypothetical protein